MLEQGNKAAVSGLYQDLPATSPEGTISPRQVNAALAARAADDEAEEGFFEQGDLLHEITDDVDDPPLNALVAAANAAMPAAEERTGEIQSSFVAVAGARSGGTFVGPSPLPPVVPPTAPAGCFGSPRLHWTALASSAVAAVVVSLALTTTLPWRTTAPARQQAAAPAPAAVSVATKATTAAAPAPAAHAAPSPAKPSASADKAKAKEMLPALPPDLAEGETLSHAWRCRACQAESDDSVVQLQRALAAVRTTGGTPLYRGSVDGLFGRKTRRAVAAYQRTMSLRHDAVVGTETANSLAEYLRTPDRAALAVVPLAPAAPRRPSPVVADGDGFQPSLEATPDAAPPAAVSVATKATPAAAPAPAAPNAPTPTPAAPLTPLTTEDAGAWLRYCTDTSDPEVKKPEVQASYDYLACVRSGAQYAFAAMQRQASVSSQGLFPDAARGARSDTPAVKTLFAAEATALGGFAAICRQVGNAYPICLTVGRERPYRDRSRNVLTFGLDLGR